MPDRRPQPQSPRTKLLKCVERCTAQWFVQGLGAEGAKAIVGEWAPAAAPARVFRRMGAFDLAPSGVDALFRRQLCVNGLQNFVLDYRLILMGRGQLRLWDTTTTFM